MVRAIVVGAGEISNAWFGPLKQENVEIAAVVDLRKDAAEQQIAKFQLPGAIASDNLDKTLAEHQADFLVDLTIPPAHCAVTCKSLQRGLHVIGEKPMAENMDQARRMLETSRRAGKLYMVSQSRRYAAPVIALRDAVHNKTVGEVTSILCDFYLGAHFTGFRTQTPNILLADMAIHHFDMARMFTGLDPVSVYCRQSNPDESWFSHGSNAHAIFEMTGGVLFTYCGSWCAEGRHSAWNGDWRVQCASGSLHYEQDQPPFAHRVAAAEGFTRPSQRIDFPLPQLDVGTTFESGMRGQLREMLRYLRDGTLPQCHAADNIKSFAMVCAAVESSRTGQRINIADL